MTRRSSGIRFRRRREDASVLHGRAPLRGIVVLGVVGVAVTCTIAQTTRPAFSDRPASNDWAATGWDCTLFAVADIDGDGLGDLLTINGNRDLCVAFNVYNWKTAPWEVLASEIPADATALVAERSRVTVHTPDHALALSDYRDGRLQQRERIEPRHSPPTIAGATIPLDPPPFETTAALFRSFAGDINGDGVLDAIGVFTATKPHNHNIVRIALAPNPNSPDQDSDGVTDDVENRIGSNPLDNDTDDDGLIDGWEVSGLPRNIVMPESDAPGSPLNPLRQDVILAVSRYEQVDEAEFLRQTRRAAECYSQLPNVNVDGSTGVHVHYRVNPPVPADKQHGGNWGAVGNEQLASHERGFMHWMQVTPGGGGQAMQTGDMGGSGCNWAAFAHEFGHQLSLSHEGDSVPAWCPLYPSMMNYAFSYSLGGDGNAIRFSDGRFASVSLDESRLIERLPFSYDSLKYLEHGPFRFTLKADGESSTLIDWNQNGVFDEGEVSADINYGGSTNGGTRRNHDLIGAQPALCSVGGQCFLVTIDQSMAAISIKNYLGHEQWSERRPVSQSAADSEPVVLGLDDHGLIFFHRHDGWRVSRFTADAIADPIHLPDLPHAQLSVGRVNGPGGGRVLLISRFDDDHLEARWLDWNEPPKPAITSPWTLELKSQTPVAFTQHPQDQRVAMVTSMPNARGAPMCMRVTWFLPPQSDRSDRLVMRETIWTRGENSGNNCTTRPVISITDDGQLFIFHTGWPDENGQMIAYRTRQIGNKTLDEGWLTSMMYDIWTRTRVGVAFANGAHGAIYAYRWDSGEHGDMHVNQLQTAHNGLGIDPHPMRDHDDVAKITQWGIRHSILNIRRD